MYSAKCFKDHKPSVLDKFFQTASQKEIMFPNNLAFMQFLPSTFKVKAHVQILQKFSNWILIGIRFL